MDQAGLQGVSPRNIFLRRSLASVRKAETHWQYSGSPYSVLATSPTIANIVVDSDAVLVTAKGLMMPLLSGNRYYVAVYNPTAFSTRRRFWLSAVSKRCRMSDGSSIGVRLCAKDKLFILNNLCAGLPGSRRAQIDCTVSRKAATIALMLAG